MRLMMLCVFAIGCSGSWGIQPERADRIRIENDARRDSAIRSLYVTPAQLDVVEVELSQLSGFGVIEHEGKRYFADPSFAPPRWAAVPLVVDMYGNLYELVEKPRKIASHATLRTGCRPPARASWSSEMPEPDLRILRGPLPDGMTWKGKLEVRYDEVELVDDYLDGDCS